MDYVSILNFSEKVIFLQHLDYSPGRKLIYMIRYARILITLEIVAYLIDDNSFPLCVFNVIALVGHSTAQYGRDMSWVNEWVEHWCHVGFSY